MNRIESNDHIIELHRINKFSFSSYNDKKHALQVASGRKSLFYKSTR